MMHWKTTLCVLALFFATLVVTGCSQPCCYQAYDGFIAQSGLPPHLANDPDVSNQRALPDPVRQPTSINDVERDPRYLTLSECIAMALENGSVGIQSINSIFNAINISGAGFSIASTVNDLGTFNGAQLTGSDSVRVFALQPAITQTDIESSLSRYDVVSRTVLGVNTVDQNPQGAEFQVNGQFAKFGTSLEKALPTGGVADITFGNAPGGLLSNADFQSQGNSFYSKYAPGSPFISGYSADLRAGFTQPLLKGFGTDVNSVLTQHPNSPAQQYGGANAPAMAIARINYNQSRAEFERIVNYMVLNVEAAYFVLYGSYVNLYSTEQALRQSYTVWKISKAKFEAGSVTITGFAQTRAQYEDFRAQRVNALSNVLEKERALRVLCGMPVEDGKRLVPIDTPTVQEFRPDWVSGLKEAMALRPELAIAREDVRRRQLELLGQKNSLLPTVNLEGSYGIHGFGSALDGDGVFANGLSTNALRDLASNHFADYNIGLSATVPLGYRAQHAAVRVANLKVAQAYLVLRDQELKAQNNLVIAWRAVIADYAQVGIRRSQREASAEQVEARFKEYLAGKTTVDFVLTAQQQWAQALTQEYQAITNYNVDLALYQFTKGTLLTHNSIQIAEDALPQCIQVRAVENERQRAQSLVLMEHAAEVPHAACDPVSGVGSMPILPKDAVPSLPALNMDKRDRVPAEALGQLQVGQPMSSVGPTGTAQSLVTVNPALAQPTSQTLSSQSLPTTPPNAAPQALPALEGLPFTGIR